MNSVVNKIDGSFQQLVLSNKVNLFDLIRGVLEQIGRADISISTFANSEDFLRVLFKLKNRGLIGHATLINDIMFTKKTLKMSKLLQNVYDEVYFVDNHSKCTLIENEKHRVGILSTQNQTRIKRFECHLISNDENFFSDLKAGFEQMRTKARKANDILTRHTERNRRNGDQSDQD